MDPMRISATMFKTQLPSPYHFALYAGVTLGPPPS
jgi:hypothetical protein